MQQDIKKIQTTSFEILKELIQLFDKYDMTYFLAGGTFLGAVRHKGFIPWDDDIDISMPREDYERFLKLKGTELPKYIKISNFKTDSQYRYFITRVQDSRYNIREIRTGELTHPAVDILPLDGAPNNAFKRFFYYRKIMAIRYMISCSNRDIIDRNRRRSILEKIIINIITVVPFEKIFNQYKLKILLEKSMIKYDIKNSEFTGCLMGAYRTKEMIPTKYYGEGRKYKFENIYANAPEKEEQYLSALYGDYMKIPNEVEIQEKVHYTWEN